MTAKSIYRLGRRSVRQLVGRQLQAEVQRQLGRLPEFQLRVAALQGLLVGVLSSTDFNQPPSMRPISLQVESSCW